MRTALGVACVLIAACAPREWLLPKFGLEPPALRDFGPGFVPPLSSETGAPSRSNMRQLKLTPSAW